MKDANTWRLKESYLIGKINSIQNLRFPQLSPNPPDIATILKQIEDTLDTLPEAYDRPLFAQKCSALFEHVYESYPELDLGVYAKEGAASVRI